MFILDSVGDGKDGVEGGEEVGNGEWGGVSLIFEGSGVWGTGSAWSMGYGWYEVKNRGETGDVDREELK